MSRKAEITKNILKIIGVTGVIVIALVLPGLPAAFAPFLRKKNRSLSKTQIGYGLGYLIKNRYVLYSKENGKVTLKITEQGRKKINDYKLEDLKLQRPTKWDGKWRAVMFDIPLDKSINRTVFTRKLKELEFYQLQKSVWVTPYPCETEIEYLKDIYEIKPFVRTAIIDSFDVQLDLLKKFNIA